MCVCDVPVRQSQSVLMVDGREEEGHGAGAAGDGFGKRANVRANLGICAISSGVWVCVNEMLDHYHQLRQQTAALWRVMKVCIYADYWREPKMPKRVRMKILYSQLFANVRFCTHQKRTLAITAHAKGVLHFCLSTKIH